MDLIFAEPWWLDTVAPGRWEEIKVEDSGTSARWIFTREKHRTGLMKIENPPLSPRLGPMIRVPSDRKAAKSIAAQKSLMNELIALVPKHDYLIQACTSDFKYWLPFYWAGYRQTTHYSHVLDNPSDQDAVWSGLTQNHRRAIKKGRERYEIRYDFGSEILVEMLEATFGRQGLKLGRPPSLIMRLAETAIDHDSARLIVAVDEGGRPIAAALIVWDDTTAYYLLGGRADHDGIDAMPLVLWDGIELAGELSRRFDFEGSMVEGIENFFRGFGGTPEPYSILSHASRRMEVSLAARQVAKAIRG